MKIKKLHIIGFGGMKNCELILDANFNLIHGSNEYGKTTIFSFIRAMLFGLKGTSKAIQSDYKKYIPLDNPHNFKGEMYIDINGVEYKIERNFHRDTRSTKITDIENAKILTETEWINLLSPLDFETFTSTCYINSESGNPGTHFMNILQERIIGLAESNSGDILVHSSITKLNNEQKTRRNKIKELSIYDEFELIDKKNIIDSKISTLENDIINSKTNVETSTISVVLVPIISMLGIIVAIFLTQNTLRYIIICFLLAFSLSYITYFFKKVQNEKLEMDKSKDFLNGQLKELYSQKGSIESDLQKCNENKQICNELLNEFNALQLARDTINSIAKEMYSKNTNELNTELSRVFSSITDNSFRGVFVNDDMNIYAVKDNNTLYGLEHLSRGTLEQLYLSLRIVTINLIYKNLNLPIIIDDGFVHYDYKRYKNTVTMLEKLDNQVIIFNLSKSVF